MSEPHRVVVVPPPNLYISPEQAKWVRDFRVRMSAGDYFAGHELEQIKEFFVYIERMVPIMK